MNSIGFAVRIRNSTGGVGGTAVNWTAMGTWKQGRNMKFYYSNETKGFYLDEMHGQNIPGDATALKDGEHEKALAWQGVGGLIAGVNSDGTMLLKKVQEERQS